MSCPIHIAHSPDADDIFMFWAMATGKIQAKNFTFQVCHRNIEDLNQMALRARYEITALSFHAYFHVNHRYELLSSGASTAEKDWGPRLVCKQESLAKLSSTKNLRRIAVPGLLTTAALITKIFLPHAELIPMRFDKIMPAIKEDSIDAGVIIHEGQMFFQNWGLVEITSLAEVWRGLCLTHREKILPLPLGGNAIRKDLGEKKIRELDTLCRDSVIFAGRHRQEVLSYLHRFRPDLSAEQLTQYLSWYANERTVHLDAEAREAIQFLQELAVSV